MGQIHISNVLEVMEQILSTVSSTMYASTTVPYPPKKCRLCTTWGSNRGNKHMHFGKYYLPSSLNQGHSRMPMPRFPCLMQASIHRWSKLRRTAQIHVCDYTASNDMVRDGSDPIEVPVSNGRYLVLLGGQGMRPLPASLFHENDELYVVYADLPNDDVGQVKLGELQRMHRPALCVGCGDGEDGRCGE